MLVPIRMVTNIAGRKPTETCVTELCYLRVNSSLEELINIYINTMTIQIANPPHSHFFSLHGSPLVRSLSACLIHVQYH